MTINTNDRNVNSPSKFMQPRTAWQKCKPELLDKCEVLPPVFWQRWHDWKDLDSDGLRLMSTQVHPNAQHTATQKPRCRQNCKRERDKGSCPDRDRRQAWQWSPMTVKTWTSWHDIVQTRPVPAPVAIDQAQRGVVNQDALQNQSGKALLVYLSSDQQHVTGSQ